MLGWVLVFQRACSPVSHFTVLLLMWAGIWAFMLVGAAIMQAIENPTREEPAALSIYQPPMDYLDAVYFTAVYLTSCGLGDILPLTAGGRAFLCIWSFIGTTLWLVLASSLAVFLCDWIYVKIILNFVWYYTVERYVQSAMQAVQSELMNISSPRLSKRKSAAKLDAEEVGAAAPEEVVAPSPSKESSLKMKKSEGGASTECPDGAGGADLEEGVGPRQRRRSVHGDSWEEVEKRSLGEEVLSWKALLILNLIALFVYFSVHLFYTGILISIDHNLGNLGELTPDSFATAFYASYTFSQTICFGTDYSPKAADSKAFFVAWQQFNLIAATFLFTTVMLAIIRTTRAKLFLITERILKRNYRANRKRLFAQIRQKFTAQDPLQREMEARMSQDQPDEKQEMEAELERGEYSIK